MNPPPSPSSLPPPPSSPSHRHKLTPTTTFSTPLVSEGGSLTRLTHQNAMLDIRADIGRDTYRGRCQGRHCPLTVHVGLAGADLPPSGADVTVKVTSPSPRRTQLTGRSGPTERLYCIDQSWTRRSLHFANNERRERGGRERGGGGEEEK